MAGAAAPGSTRSNGHAAAKTWEWGILQLDGRRRDEGRFRHRHADCGTRHRRRPGHREWGAGRVEDFAPAVRAGADAVLAASVFHFGELTIGAVKTALSDAGITVRTTGKEDAHDRTAERSA